MARGKGKRLTALEQESLVSRYAAGESIASLVAEFGIDRKTLSNTRRRLGVARRPMPSLRGSDHWNFKGGRITTKQGYINVLVEQGDALGEAMQNNKGYVLEHRLVMARQLGRPLRNSETVHHINGVRDDNRPDNLQLRASAHGPGTSARCGDCGSHNIHHEQV